MTPGEQIREEYVRSGVLVPDAAPSRVESSGPVLRLDAIARRDAEREIRHGREWRSRRAERTGADRAKVRSG